MAKNTKQWLKKTEAVKVRRLKLPRKRGEDGEIIKLDPGNMPKKIVKTVLAYLKDEHGYHAKPL